MTRGLPNNASALCQGQDFVTCSSASPGLTPRCGAKAGAGGSGRLRSDLGPRSAKHLNRRPGHVSSRGCSGIGDERWVGFTQSFSRSRAGPVVLEKSFSPSLLWGCARGMGNVLVKLQLREPASTKTRRAPWKLRHFSKEMMSLLSPSRQQTPWTGSRQHRDNIIYKLFGKLSEMMDKCLERPAVPTFHPVWNRWW